MPPHRPVYDPDTALFRETARRFAAKEIAPHFAGWEGAGIVDRALWPKGGETGLLCPQVPEDYGGVGGDFRLNAIVLEELWYAGYSGPGADFSVHSDVCCGYLVHYGTEAQKAKWLPRMVAGEVVCAIAMTEPGTGSDLQGIRTRARRVDGGWRVDGQKTFISNGQHADLVIVVTRTDPQAGSKGMTLLLIEATAEGFRRGRNLDKLGQISADTSELFFDDVFVPEENLLGREGGAMAALMSELPQERLTIAIQSMATAQRAFDITRDYVRERKAFGRPIGDFQNTRYKLADMKADLMVGWAYVDQCIARHCAGELAGDEASAAKLWTSEMLGRLVDQCLQFFGGYGFMRESEICRLFADARVLRIYGGTSEIMRELVARNL